MVNRRLFFGFGLLVWLLATVIFRLAGQAFFLFEQPAALALIWAATAAGLILVVLLLFRWQRLPRAQRFAAVFPNMSAEAASSFGAWLLWAYACALLAALLPARQD